LADQLQGGSAHVTFAEAVADLPVKLRGFTPDGTSHSPWHVLEHLRITQWDILNFCRDPEHVSPQFPEGYWPSATATPSASAWERSVAAFAKDLADMQKLVLDEHHDLHARVNHPEARDHHTLAREALVLIDHNAYHLGELVLLRRLLGAWPTKR
jgi:hypothetical protein